MACNVTLVHGRRTLIHNAIKDKNLDKLTELLDKGENIELAGGQYGETPLQFAVYKNGGFPAAVSLLIERGANLNTIQGMQKTPLMIAATFNRVEIVEDLIAAGADATLHSIVGHSAEDYAKLENHTALAATIQLVATSQAKLGMAKQDTPTTQERLLNLAMRK